MKKMILLFMMLVSAWSASFADESGRLDIKAGVFAPYTLEATIGYEMPIGFGHAIEIFGEAGTHWQTPVCHMFWKKYYWDGGAAYKHQLVRFKNGNFRIVGGAYCGAFQRNCFFGFEAGFEYNYTFANNWQLTLSQKNQFNFLNGDHFRNGVMIGVKIPL